MNGIKNRLIKKADRSVEQFAEQLKKLSDKELIKAAAEVEKQTDKLPQLLIVPMSEFFDELEFYDIAIDEAMMLSANSKHFDIKDDYFLYDVRRNYIETYTESNAAKYIRGYIEDIANVMFNEDIEMEDIA